MRKRCMRRVRVPTELPLLHATVACWSGSLWSGGEGVGRTLQRGKKNVLKWGGWVESGTKASTALQDRCTWGRSLSLTPPSSSSSSLFFFFSSIDLAASFSLEGGQMLPPPSPPFHTECSSVNHKSGGERERTDTRFASSLPPPSSG